MTTRVLIIIALVLVAVGVAIFVASRAMAQGRIVEANRLRSDGGATGGGS